MKRLFLGAAGAALLSGCAIHRPFIDVPLTASTPPTLAEVTKYAQTLREAYTNAAQEPMTYNALASTLIIPLTAYTIGMLANGEQSDAPQILGLTTGAALAGSSLVSNPDRQRFYLQAAAALSCMQLAAANAGSYEFTTARQAIERALEIVDSAIARQVFNESKLADTLVEHNVSSLAQLDTGQERFSDQYEKLVAYGNELNARRTELRVLRDELNNLEGAAAARLLARIRQLQDITNAAVLRTQVDPVAFAGALPATINAGVGMVSTVTPAPPAPPAAPPSVLESGPDRYADARAAVRTLLSNWEDQAAADHQAVNEAILAARAEMPSDELRLQFVEIGKSCLPNSDLLPTAFAVANTQVVLTDSKGETTVNGGVAPYGRLNVPADLTVEIIPVRTNLARVTIEYTGSTPTADQTRTFQLYDASTSGAPITVTVSIPKPAG